MCVKMVILCLSKLVLQKHSLFQTLSSCNYNELCMHDMADHLQEEKRGECLFGKEYGRIYLIDLHLRSVWYPAQMLKLFQ